MKKSQAISLIVIFVVVSVIILVNAIAGPKNSNALSRPTQTNTIINKPTTLPEKTPGGDENPTEGPAGPDRTSVPGPDSTTVPPVSTPTKEPKVYTRPDVDVSIYKNLSTKEATWNCSSKLEDESDRDSRVYSIDSEAKKVLGDYEYIYNMGKTASGKKRVYLTFSLAYEDREKSTVRILDTLKNNGVKATFFISKGYLKDSPDIVQRIIEDGHLVGTRGDISVKTDGSTGMVYTSAQKFCDILWEMEEKYQEIAGNTSRMFYYRPDKISVRDMELAAAMGYKVVFRSYNYRDWDEYVGYSKALSNLVAASSDGAVIQLSSSIINADIMQDYITEMLRLGYTFERLDG